MTDKQIIFKCDVDCIRKNTEECFELDCIKGQESILKQLKAKEQECEELKIYIESNEQQVKEVETLVMDNDRLINELDQLKAENEELKNFHINLVGVKECEIKELVKYKQALTEIKEIANKFDYWNNNLSQASEILHEIIEKISEVLDE